MTDPADQQPIFVVGNSRSGTTLMRNMLSAHPRIHLTMEASFYLWGGSYTPWRDQDGFPPYYVRSFSFRWLRTDPRPILRGLPRPFGFVDRKRLYTAVMRQQAAERGKVRHGDKTPGHSGNLGRIFADYPEAKVIRMLRDPRDVVRSLTRMPWAPASPTACAALVELERLQVRRHRHRLLEVQLSELVGAPGPTMERVLDHVGEPYHTQVLQPEHYPDDVPPMPWFDSARTAPRSQARTEPDPVQIRWLEAMTRSALSEQALPTKALVREPGWVAVGSRWLADLPLCLHSVGVGLGLAWASRGGSASGRVAQRWMRRLNPSAWQALDDFEMPDPPPLPEGWEAAWS
ncbi:MAG: sulfotransferase [Myxococcales bacterium]|nr:sulfotransferase [Myxococcales bacterium]